MQHIASLLLAGAIGVAAHPSGHNHGRLHNRALGDLVHATINGVDVTWTQTEDYGAVAATPTPMIKSDNVANVNANVAAKASTTSSSAAAAATTPSVASSSAKASSTASVSAGSGSGVTEYTSFTDYCATKSKRATLAEIAYTGNVGSVYGCNIMLVASEAVAAQYDNTVKFFGATSDMSCLVWNKIGEDGGINGFFGADATTFTLAAGATQYVALDANSQGGAACFSGDVEKTSYGSIAGTWLEFDVENSSNNGFSGADASCIVAQDAGLTIPGMKVCFEADDTSCSTISPGAAVVDNAYTADLAAADGIGIITSSTLKITVDVGYSS